MVARGLCLLSKLCFSKSHRGVGTSLAVQWLGLHVSTAGGTGSTPVRGTKLCGAVKKKKKRKKSLWGLPVTQGTPWPS